MKRMAAAILMLTLFASSHLRAQDLPKPTRFVLDDGLTVLAVTDRTLPLVSFQLLIPGAGTAGDEREGLPNLTAQLLLRGTWQKSAAQVASALEYFGADLRVGVVDEYFTMSGTCLAKYFPDLLAIAGECLGEPAFRADEFASERARLIEEVRAVKDDANWAVRLYFRKAYFGDHPLARLTGGTATSLARITADDVQGFYRAKLRPERAILAVVGNVELAALKKTLARSLDGWKRGTGNAPAALPPLPQPKGRKLLLIDKPDATQAYFMLGVPGLPRGDDRTAAADVMNTLFGGRFTSRLNTELRIKRGLTYGARSSMQSWQPGGLLSMTSYTKNDKIDEMLKITLEQVAAARGEGFSATEVESARNYILGQFPPTLESMSDRAEAYADLTYSQLGLDYYRRLMARVETMDVAGVNAIARQTMPGDDFVLVVVGKAEEIRARLAFLGPFQERKISDPDF